MVETDLAGRGQGPAGLPWLLSQQPAAVGRLEQAALDLGRVEGAGGDEVVQVAPGLPQLPVAPANRGGGDPGQLLDQGRPHIGRPGPIGRRQPDQQRGGRADRWALELGPEPLGQRGRGWSRPRTHR
jgi:hypothetical protein